jgi:chromosome segregation ATPase
MKVEKDFFAKLKKSEQERQKCARDIDELSKKMSLSEEKLQEAQELIKLNETTFDSETALLKKSHEDELAKILSQNFVADKRLREKAHEAKLMSEELVEVQRLLSESQETCSSQLKSSQDELMRLNKEMAEKEETICELTHKFKSLEDEACVAVKQHEESQCVISGLQKELTSITEQLAVVTADVLSLTSERNEVKWELEAVKESLAEKTEAEEKLVEKLSKLKSEFTQEQEQHVQKVEKLKIILAGESSSLKEFTKKMEDSEKANSDLQQEVISLTNKIAATQEQHSAEISSLSVQREEISSELEAMKESLAEKTEAEVKLTEKLSKLKTESEQQQYQQLTSFADLVSSIKKKEEECKELSLKLKAVQETLAEKTEAEAKLVEKLSKLQIEFTQEQEQHVQEVEKLKSVLAGESSSQKEFTKHKEANSDLQHKVTSLTNKIAVTEEAMKESLAEKTEAEVNSNKLPGPPTPSKMGLSNNILKDSTSIATKKTSSSNSLLNFIRAYCAKFNKDEVSKVESVNALVCE